MISKKVLGPALTGTGAVGASGTLAWTLGLLDEEILEDVVDGKVDVAVEAKPDQKENAPSIQEGSSKQPEVAGETAKEPKNDVSPNRTQVGQKTQTGASGGSLGVRGARIAGPSTWSAYLANDGGATAFDRKVFESGSTLKVELNKGLYSILVKVTKEAEEEFSWECRLKPISLKNEINSKNNFEEFERQKGQLEEAILKDDHKKQLVANCSRARLSEEKARGKDGIIELEAEGLTWEKYKYKEKDGYFERLWTEDFTGVHRLSENEENKVKSKENWKIKEETLGKVTISLGSRESTCNISGDYGDNLGTRTFKGGELKKILEMDKYASEIEKKKYILRNCLKNKNDIKGLTIGASGSKEWEFSDLKKIYEGMYENPKVT